MSADWSIAEMISKIMIKKSNTKLLSLKKDKLTKENVLRYELSF